MPRILVTRRVPGRAVAMLQDAFGAASVEVYGEDRAMPREVFIERARGVDAILAILTEKIDTELLEAAGPQLRIVANMAVGYDNIDVPACTAHGVSVSNTPGVLTETTADLAFGLIIAASRRFAEAERFLRSGNWGPWSPTLLLGGDIHGKTLGLYGFGRIGKAVAQRAMGFKMRVIYNARGPAAPEIEDALHAHYVDFDTLLAESDILSLHCPLTPETRHRFGAAEFQAMKKSAVFVNTTRGPVVDEAALAAALKSGEIFSAGLDVFEEEPKVHPDLLACENTVLIPHLGSATMETRGKMAEMAAANIIARLQGGTPPNCINPETCE